MHSKVEMKRKMQEFALQFHNALQKAGIPDIQVSTQMGDDHNSIMAIPAGLKEDAEWKDSLFWEVIRKCNPRSTRSLLKIKGYKRAVLVKHLRLAGIMDKCEEYVKDPDVGSTKRFERAKAKIEVKNEQKNILATDA